MIAQKSRRFRAASLQLLKALARKVGLHITRNPYSLVYEEHLSRVFSALEINCALDVGAYHGEFARHLREIGYRGRIISLEPVADNFQVLEDCRAGDPEWHAYQMALGETKGTGEIRVFSGLTFHSFLDPSEYGRLRFPEKLQIERTESVAIERLDNILGGLIEGIANPRIFLKVDTQGYDLEVLRGLGADIDKIIGLQIEVALAPIYEGMTNSFIDATVYLQELGFRLSGVFPVTFDSVNENCLVEFDCVMCRHPSLPTIRPTSRAATIVRKQNPRPRITKVGVARKAKPRASAARVDEAPHRRTPSR
jgi:FkbM family methyltransferase